MTLWVQDQGWTAGICEKPSNGPAESMPRLCTTKTTRQQREGKPGKRNKIDTVTSNEKVESQKERKHMGSEDNGQTLYDAKKEGKTPLCESTARTKEKTEWWPTQNQF